MNPSSAIVYCLVSRESNILAQFSHTSGNFTEVAFKLLQNLPKEQGRKSYSHNDYIFHLNRDGNIIFLCMANKSFSQARAFAFLADIQEKWYGSYGDKGNTAPTLGMNADFARTLRTQMVYIHIPTILRNN